MDLASSQMVSIHAPVKGATRWNAGEVLLLAGFNPRAREGRDALAGWDIGQWSTVSIHAPVKGATCGFRSVSVPRLLFQSTRP